MSPALARLKPEIDRLTIDEREELVNYLQATDESPEESQESVRAAWKAEVEARIEEFNAGHDESIPFQKFLEELRGKQPS